LNYVTTTTVLQLFSHEYLGESIPEKLSNSAFLLPPPQLITGTLTLDGMKTSWLAAVIQTRATEPNGPPKILCRMPFGRNPPNLPQLGTSPHYAGLHIPGPGYTKMHN